jgi:hypothetical protein
LKASSVVVVSAAVRGRARLHVHQLERQPALGWHLRERLSGDDRIREVRASALTGNVLVHFDAGRLHVTGLRQLIARTDSPAGSTKFYHALAAYGQVGRTDLDAPWEREDLAPKLREAAGRKG